MHLTRLGAAGLVCSVVWWSSSGQPTEARQGGSTPAPLYNTAKQKILQGKPVVGGTVASPDPNIYCAMASAGLRMSA